MEKILHIVADGDPGGGSTFVQGLIRSSPYQCGLVTQKNSYLAQHAGTDKVFEIDFFSSRIDIRASLHLYRVICKYRPNIVHVHGVRAAFFLSFIPKSWRYIYTIHGLHGVYQGERSAKWIQRWIIARMDLVVFVSHAEESLARQHRLLKKTPYCVIVNGVDPYNFPKERCESPKQLGFIGRLTKEKDPLFLLRIMDILGSQGYRLKVIGGGEYEEQMRAHPYVEVTGSLPHQQAMEACSDIAVLIVPSIWEAFGLVIVEAMAMEIPIIAAKIPSFEEILQSGSLGVLIDKKDPQLYADVILKKTALQYTKAAKKAFKERFTWGECANSYYELYGEVGNFVEVDSS